MSAEAASDTARVPPARALADGDVGVVAPMVGMDAAELGFLLELLVVYGPSGFEGRVVDLWVQRAGELGADVRRDAIGNATATFNSSADGARVMVTGHADEIGFIVTRIEPSGLLRIAAVGGWDGGVVLGQRVRVLGTSAGGPGDVHGVIARAAAHLLSGAQESDIPQLHDLWLDIGAASVEEATAAVRVGDPVVVDTRPHLYANGRLLARALDNRLGCFVALESMHRAAEREPGLRATALAAVSEEISQHGAATAAYDLRPEWAVVIDVAPATDVPGTFEEHVELGAGPVVTFGSTVGTGVGRQLVELAERRGIPVQLAAAGTRTSTDADVVGRAGSGVRVGLAEVPGRNLHVPGELCDLRDVSALVELLAAWAVERVG